MQKTQASSNQASEKPGASSGRSTAGESKPANPASMPQANPSEGAGILPPPRPRSGLTEEEYEARKAAAAKGEEPALPRAGTPAPAPLPPVKQQ
jgi:hypothetical protein